MRAYRICERAAKFGFDSQDVDSNFKKLDEELAELKIALKMANSEKLAEKLGEFLFTIVNLSRFMGVHPEAALMRTISNYIKSTSRSSD